MACQLKQPHYPHDGEGLQETRIFPHALHHVRIEAQSGRKVNDINRRLDELPQIGGDLVVKMMNPSLVFPMNRSLFLKYDV